MFMLCGNLLFDVMMRQTFHFFALVIKTNKKLFHIKTTCLIFNLVFGRD